MRILFEDDLFVLFSDDETVFLFEKDLNKEIWRFHFSEEMDCGLICEVSDWTFIGGRYLYVVKNGVLETVKYYSLEWIYQLRQINDLELGILTDPWGEFPAIWKLNRVTCEVVKSRDFPDYKNKSYTDVVDW